MSSHFDDIAVFTGNMKPNFLSSEEAFNKWYENNFEVLPMPYKERCRKAFESGIAFAADYLESNEFECLEEEKGILERDNERLIAINEKLISYLTELYAQVKGECPSLLNEDSGGDAELDYNIKTILGTATA